MWFYDLRDSIFNHLIIWLMNHCQCWATVFYTACNRYYPNEVRCLFQSWDEQNHGKWSDEQVAYRDEFGDFHFGYKCSVCGAILNKTNYCGACGTKMD